MKVLVTGGDGFIGSNLVNSLLEDGDEIVVVDNCYDGVSRYGSTKRSEGIVHMIPSDICDIQKVKDKIFNALCGAPERVYHFAAHYANLRSVLEPIQCVRTNCEGTMAVLEFCVDAGVQEMVYASSSIAATENGKPEIMTPYGITKWTGELLALAYAESKGMKLCCPRFFNVYGYGDHPGKYRAVIPNFFRMALRGEPITVTGAKQARDFTFIEDVIYSIKEGARTLSTMKDGESIVYNIAKGRSEKIVDLVELILELTKSNSKVKILPDREWEGIQDRVGDVTTFKHLFPNIAYTMSSLRTGLIKSASWYFKACK